MFTRRRLLGAVIAEIKTEEGRIEFLSECIAHVEGREGLDASYLGSAKQYLSKSRLTTADVKDAAFNCRKYFQSSEAMPNEAARVESKWQKALAERIEGNGR